MVADTRLAPGAMTVARFATPLGVLLLATLGLRAATDWDPSLVVALASAFAALAAAVFSRKLAAPFLILAVLTWSAQKTELNPLRLIENRQRATEYIFGRDLSDADRQRLLEQARRTAELSLHDQARRDVARDLQLTPDEPPPPDFTGRVEDRAELMRAALTDEEWDRRIRKRAAQTERDRRGGFFPIETNPDSLALYSDAILETVAIAIWGTLLAFLAALPAALLASHRSLKILSTGNSWLQRALRRAGVFMTRRGFDACRGFNEFVLALIFVAVIGLGPFAGVLALAVHTFGVLGKVFADSLDTINQNEVEGVLASGAPSPHVISFAVLPQVFPIVISQSLLRFESNVRSASVLGLVGAGGIGFLIDAKLKAYQFQEVATIMLIIIVLVSIIDFGCGWVVKRFV